MNPLVLERFRVFLRMIVGEWPIEIENPFIWKTKAEVIRSIVNHGCGDLIKQTVSCTQPDNISRLHTHCGCCTGCLDRRFAVMAAEASAYDPLKMYRSDVLIGAHDNAEDVTMAEAYVRSALEIGEMDERAFFGRFSSKIARVRDGFPSDRAEEIWQQVFHLHQRHTEAIQEVLKEAIEEHSMDLVKATLPSSSVLMMTVGRSEDRKKHGKSPFGLSKAKLGPGAKARGIAEAIKSLWGHDVPRGLSAKARDKAIVAWLRANGHTVPLNPQRVIQRTLRQLLR
jgi:hypothetical protein